MTEKVNVIEDGVATEVTRRRATSGWLLAAAGFVMGLGLGLVVTNSPSNVATVSSRPEAADTDSVTSRPAEARGVGGMVPGFPDTLVAVGRTTGSALNHLLWPVSGELRIDPMSSGDDVTFDRGGRFIALSESVPGLEGSILSMGRFNRMANVSGGVTSYVWHDSETGVLAYTSESDGSWQLFVAGPDLESELLIESPEMVGSLVGFGDWGWAVQMGPDSLALLTPDTHLKAVEPGVGYASHPDGWVFMIDDGPKVVSAGGGVKRIDADLGVGTVTAAAISPDRQYVAVAGATGWTVLNTASGTVEPHIGLSSSSLAWSSDSRFVLSAAGSGVTIYDMDTATPYFVLSSQGVRAVGTAPLRSS